jgi:tetratricopeptide (TPR) repeat protein
MPGMKERFAAEKKFHNAYKQYQTIQLKPGGVEPAQYRRIREMFRQIVRDYPAEDVRHREPLSDEVRRDLLNLIGTSQMSIADLFFQEGQLDSAVTMYQKIVDQYPDNQRLRYKALYSIATSYQQSGRWSDAVAAFDTILQDYPPIRESADQPDITILEIPSYLAATYQSMGDSVSAGVYFTRALNYLHDVSRKWPGTATEHFALDQIANIHLMQKEWSQAIEIFDQISSAYQDSLEPPKALFAMAAVYWEKLQELDRALTIYQDLIEQYPQSSALSKAFLGIGKIYLQRGQLAEARQTLRRVIEEYPQEAGAGANAQYSIALSLEIEGEWDKALNEFRWILSNYPNSREALHVPRYILDHYLQFSTPDDDVTQSAYRGALRDYENIISRDPESPQAALSQWYIADIHISMAQWEQAAEALEDLIEKYPQHPQLLISHLKLGEIYELRLGRPDKAIQTYQQLVNLAPNSQSSEFASSRIEHLRGAVE